MVAVQTHVSQEDRSVNFVFHNGQEARYVRRTDEYFIVYLSSHSGCDKACRFCHLTQTKQTDMRATTSQEFLDQAQRVIGHYLAEVQTGRQKPAQRINFNWMARGEPMANPYLQIDWVHISVNLRKMAREAGIRDVRFNLSTIMPVGMPDLWPNDWHVNTPRIYYSLYSTDPAFRKRWLPKALPVAQALEMLRTYQLREQGEVVLHWPFIEGENDSRADVDETISLLRASGLETRFNLVRYNPYSHAQGKESRQEVLQARFAQLLPHMSRPGSKIVPRVGFDVKASCGMFIDIKKEA